MIARWALCGFGEPVPVCGLAERIAALARCADRPALAEDQWLPRMPPQGSPASLVAAAIPRLPHLDVTSLASALGWRRGRVGCVCQEAFGAPAKDLLLFYVSAAHGALKRGGATNAACAEALALHDRSSLRHALVRAEKARRRLAGAVQMNTKSSASAPAADPRGQLWFPFEAPGGERAAEETPDDPAV
jgi:hypothetical protein